MTRRDEEYKELISQSDIKSKIINFLILLSLISLVFNIILFNSNSRNKCKLEADDLAFYDTNLYIDDTSLKINLLKSLGEPSYDDLVDGVEDLPEYSKVRPDYSKCE